MRRFCLPMMRSLMLDSLLSSLSSRVCTSLDDSVESAPDAEAEDDDVPGSTYSQHANVKSSCSGTPGISMAVADEPSVGTRTLSS